MPKLALALVTDSVEVGDTVRVAVLTRSPGDCQLALDGPSRLKAGPFKARQTKRYGQWSWKVPSRAKSGQWTARVTCTTNKRKRSTVTSQIDVAFDPAGAVSLAPKRGVTFSSSNTAPLLPTLPATAGGKGAGGYPDGDALCKWTGKRTGPCKNYDWGYRQTNGSWSLLSSRLFNYRNCTDYAAWATGLTWGSFRFSAGRGHAADWNDFAGNAGFAVTRSASVGDIAGWEAPAPYGHVAIVTAVNANGTVTTSDYNGDALGNNTTRANVRADWYLHRGGSGPGTTVTPPPPPSPPRPDTDGDGVLDQEDPCPTSPGPASNRGCPLGTRWLSADVNGDDKADLLHLWSGGINTLLSNGNGTYALEREAFKPRADYIVDPIGTRWLSSDVNGDGRDDLSHIWNGGINTLISGGDGTFAVASEGWKPRTDYNINATGTTWLAGDINADGRSDLVHAWDGGNGGINALLGSGDGTYSVVQEGWKPRPDYRIDITNTRWILGDVSGDQKADLVNVWTGGINTLHSNGDGTFVLAAEGWKPRPDYNVNPTGTRWLTGDSNGDGRADLLHVWDVGAGGINTLLSNADGTYPLIAEGWKPRPNYAMDVTNTKWLVGDATGDHRTDIINLWVGGANTLASAGDGTFPLNVEAWKPRPDYNIDPGVDWTGLP